MAGIRHVRHGGHWRGHRCAGLPAHLTPTRIRCRPCRRHHG
jgi:hypothetical protein